MQISEGGVYISMSAYSPGNAPALIINHTPYTINLWEKGSINVRYVGNALKRSLNLTPGCGELSYILIYLYDSILYIDRSVQSYNRMFYTWENPAGPRKLVWEDNNGKEIEDNLRKVNREDDEKQKG